MAEHRGQVKAVMIGVGAAFDFLSGNVRRAPPWMRKHGLEWLHRLSQEPQRLWRRYLTTNSLFLWRVISFLADSRFETTRAGSGKPTYTRSLQRRARGTS